jgi:hypothetical protein
MGGLQTRDFSGSWIQMPIPTAEMLAKFPSSRIMDKMYQGNKLFLLA